MSPFGLGFGKTKYIKGKNKKSDQSISSERGLAIAKQQKISDRELCSEQLLPHKSLDKGSNTGARGGDRPSNPVKSHHSRDRNMPYAKR